MMKLETTILDIKPKRQGEFNPLIVEFLNGDVPEKKISTVKAKLIPHENLTDKAVVISTSDKQKYVNDPINKLFLDSKFIAIRNKKTNKVRLVEVEFTPLINSLYLKKKEMKVESKDNKEQLATLQRLFGTKRAVRQLERKEALDIDKSFVENQVNELLENIPAAESSALNESLSKANNNAEEECLSNLVPTCHRDATNVFDVYKVEDCISEIEISSLMKGVQEIQNEDNKLEAQSPFLRAYLPHALSKTENLDVRLACLLYANALVIYLKTNAKNLGKAASVLCPHSKMIGDKIIREFCVKTGSTVNRPLIMKDKAVCYIIVLTLIACGYRIDLDALAKVTGYGYKKMTQLGRIVGVVPADKKTSVYALVLPLPPPMKMVKKPRAASKR